MAGKVFINYRRKQSEWAAWAIHERLKESFGKDGLFLDVAHLTPGRRLSSGIQAPLDGCDVMLALIGPQWMAEIQQRDGAVKEMDWVRKELREALQRRIPVVPVALGDTALPTLQELPADLH
jgi:hypothetical protein